MAAWLNSYRAKKEKAKEVPRHQRSEGRVARGFGDASAGEARREQKARQERQTQTQPGKAAGRRRSQLRKPRLQEGLHEDPLHRVKGCQPLQMRERSGCRRSAFFCVCVTRLPGKYIGARFVKEFNSHLMMA